MEEGKANGSGHQHQDHGGVTFMRLVEDAEKYLAASKAHPDQESALALAITAAVYAVGASLMAEIEEIKRRLPGE